MWADVSSREAAFEIWLKITFCSTDIRFCSNSDEPHFRTCTFHLLSLMLFLLCGMSESIRVYWNICMRYGEKSVHGKRCNLPSLFSLQQSQSRSNPEMSPLQKNLRLEQWLCVADNATSVFVYLFIYSFLRHRDTIFKHLLLLLQNIMIIILEPLDALYIFECYNIIIYLFI